MDPNAEAAGQTEPLTSKQVLQLAGRVVSGGTQRTGAGKRRSAPEQCRWKETARGDPSAVTGRGFGRSGEPITSHLSGTPTVLVRWEEQGQRGSSPPTPTSRNS